MQKQVKTRAQARRDKRLERARIPSLMSVECVMLEWRMWEGRHHHYRAHPHDNINPSFFKLPRSMASFFLGQVSRVEERLIY